ncbi:MAG TPA: energy-coupling factor transporter transmembrane component T [Jiangellaceae bacterium]|nr:energy-coupling factor transporter transmembrane component T [Jiangellaceae bacterium]
MSPKTGCWLAGAPASVKLGGFAVLATGVLMLPSAPAVGLAGVGLMGLYASAGLRPVVVWTQLRPLRWVLLVLFGFQAVSRGWEVAVVVTGKLAITVALAGLLTLTTRASELLETLERVMRRVPGVNADRAALVLTLAIRAIPVVAGLAAEIRDAQRARGGGLDVRAYGVPLVVRSLRYSDGLGEALVARGLDD